jgi:hypothetical protein
MRKSEAINFLNLKFIHSVSGKSKICEEGIIYMPLEKNLITYSYPDLKKLTQIEYSDDILDFHLYKENESDNEIKSILVGKSNKCITVYDKDGQKENEL